MKFSTQVKPISYLKSHVAETVKEIPNQYRQVVSGLNRIVCEVRQDSIYIHMFVDVRRDMHALLTRRLLRDA